MKKKRYFWLDVKEHKILYYKTKGNGNELGSISLESAYAIHPTPNEKPGSFQVKKLQ